MSIGVVVFYLFVTLSIISMLHYGFYLVGANIYDVRAMKKRTGKQRRKHRAVPLVTVLVPAHNEELTIVRCLESIRVNTYRKTQVVIVNDASTDDTRKIVEAYIAKHPTRGFQLVSKHKNVGKARALNSALRRYVRGELVMTLDADSFIDRHAIARAVRYFDDPKVAGVAANVRILHQPSVLGLLQRFEHMIGYRSKKFYSITNSEFIVGGVASTFRRSVMSRVGHYDTDSATEDISLSLKIAALGNKQHRIVYGADILAMTEGVQSFTALMSQRYRWKLGSLQNLIKFRRLTFARSNKYSKMLTFYRLPMAFLAEVLLIIEPLIVLYLVALSVSQLSFGLLFGAYLAISGIILITLWSDEHISTKRKASLSLYVPAMYFVFYIMNVVQIIAIIRCLVRPKRLLGEPENGSVWKSPLRLGKHVIAGE